MNNLTDIQIKALEFIRKTQEDTGSVPTLRELCSHMGYKAVGSAQDLVGSLRKKGYLQVPDKQSARTMLLTEKARSLFNNARATLQTLEDSFAIPCLGSVPAGDPLEAIENSEQVICVSGTIFRGRRPSADKLFALRAKGSSMIGAGILDGDWLVVASQSQAEKGAIVVARVEGDATVKRLEHDKSRGYFLQPENPSFEPIFADEHPFEVIGKVVALQRAVFH